MNSIYLYSIFGLRKYTIYNTSNIQYLNRAGEFDDIEDTAQRTVREGNSQSIARQIHDALAANTPTITARFNAQREEDNARDTSAVDSIRSQHTTDIESLRTDLPPIRGSSNRESNAANTKASVERVLNKNKFSKNYTFESTDDCFDPPIGGAETNKRALLNSHRDKRYLAQLMDYPCYETHTPVAKTQFLSFLL